MKIRYLKAHFGIQPGTVVDEHREKVVAQLTRTETIDPETRKPIPLAPIAELVDDGEPTTAELEEQGKSLSPAAVQTKPIKAPGVRTKSQKPAEQA